MDEEEEGQKRRAADAEMARVLNTKPLNIVSGLDPASGGIAHWKHGALHDVVQPMADHVIMTYIDTMQPLERRGGRSVAKGVARQGVVTIIPAGTSARWDINGAVDVVQLYLPEATIERISAEAGNAPPAELLERTAHLDPITSRLLTTAAEALDGHATLDAMFRQQITDLLATRLLVAHVGAPVATPAISGGLSPGVLRRALERLRTASDADVSLAALAADAGLSRFHFCRAFKESTGMPPHAWLRHHRLERAKAMLCDPSMPVVTVAVVLGYASQTAFAAAFKKLTGLSPSQFRRQTI
jgi:AraC family transcriptional regulator